MQHQKSIIYHHLRDHLQKKYFTYLHGVIVFINSQMQLKFGLKKIRGLYVIRLSWLTNLIIDTKGTHLEHNEIQKIATVLTERANKTVLR